MVIKELIYQKGFIQCIKFIITMPEEVEAAKEEEKPKKPKPKPKPVPSGGTTNSTTFP